MIPIEPKFANETRNTEIIPFALSEISAFGKIPIATNSFESTFVAIILPDWTASAQGIPAKNANGANTNPINVWKSQEIDPPDTNEKILAVTPFNKPIMATYPINIAATITATLNPSKIYSPSISKNDCFSPDSSIIMSSSLSSTV